MVGFSIIRIFEKKTESSRVAALFAVLFIITLLIAISFITVIAILTDGFSTLAAASYLNNMKRDVNPCIDFYEFVCGRYSSQKVIPEHEKKVTVLNEMKSDLDRNLRDILEKTSKHNISRPMKLSQIYYESCMDEDSQDDLGILPLTALISKLGGWELLTNARFDSVDYHWETLAGQLALDAVDGFVRIFVHNSFDDSKQQILMFSPPKLFLEKKKFYREAPSSNVYLGYYRRYILGLLELLGVDMEDDSGVIDFQVNDIIDFERRIANLTRSENPRNHTVINNVMTFGQFRKRYHQINWDLFFNDDIRSYLGVLNDRLPVNVVDPGYFDGLSGLIKSKPLSSVNNYLMWRFVSAYDSYLPLHYRKPYQEFKENMFGSTAEAGDMISDLKHSMEQTLLNADWIDEATREVALRKLERMGQKIGFPDYLLNETTVLAPYAGIRLTANQYFNNALTLKKMAVKEILSKLQRPPSTDEWVSPVITVDAFHYFTGNEISAQYDEKGNLRRWWHPETLATFQKKKQCFVAQYDSKVEPVTQRKVDGRLTIGENIADNGGLRVAYQAFQMRLARSPENFTLPGLTSFTPQQLFFIAYANVNTPKPNSETYKQDPRGRTKHQLSTTRRAVIMPQRNPEDAPNGIVHAHYERLDVNEMVNISYVVFRELLEKADNRYKDTQELNITMMSRLAVLLSLYYCVSTPLV
uniref:Neprilysin n=1 Tax=Heterorhabditis bacteriophora TaxID=37862 RepID=A0A1I7XAS8_HETBA